MTTSLRPSHQIRRSASRGHLRTDWLDARFSFSFAGYHDPLRTRFGPLLALNEDRVQPRTGFAMHPHRDLEILMIPLQGEIEHRDSQGGHAVVQCGDVQFMRAGRGIHHSQMNPSADTVDHHLQIWLEPRTRDLEPSVEQCPLPATTASPWTCIASPDGRGDSFAIDADVTIEQAALAAQAWLEIAPQGRRRYLHVVSGKVVIHLGGGLEVMLRDGDALVAIDDRERLQLHGVAAVTRLISFEAAGHDAMPAR